MSAKNENPYLIRIYEVLKKKDMKAADLAKATSFSRQVISRWKHHATSRMAKPSLYSILYQRFGDDYQY